ncbi:hypothetical protein RI367_003434 [Sorochytrium milnesiophthora]
MTGTATNALPQGAPAEYQQPGQGMPNGAAYVTAQDNAIDVADGQLADSPHSQAVDSSDATLADSTDDATEIPPLAAHEQMDIAFQDLSYNITIGKGKKRLEKNILKGVSGRFGKGRLTVILGASGAGKTSLLNVLAGETKLGTIYGSLFINGQPSNGAVMKKVSGFVHQDDVVLGTMTVQEAINMSATLRLPKTFSAAEKDQKVDEIIHMLGLNKCRNTIIGTATEKGVSGGERKRACMAMELITNPSIIYLDEPTSGLDTYTAYAVVKLLKDLATSGRTVIATLHQPSSEIFHLIDDLCLMSQGEIMYHGPAEQSVSYFARLGYQCPQYSNPADFFFMDILNTSSTSQRGADKAALKKNPDRIAGLLQEWKNSDSNRQMLKEMTVSHGDGVSRDNYKFRSAFGTQYGVLFRRAFRNAMRNRMVVKAKLGQTLFMSILMGLIYLNVSNRDSHAQVQDRAGSLFFLSTNMVMSNAMGILSVFSAEKQVFQREYGAGYYGLPAYFLSKMAVELPFQILLPFLFTCIFYWMVGYAPEAGRFFTTALFAIVLSGCGTAIGTLAASLFSTLQVALAIVPLTLLPLMIFGGLFVNSANLPVFLRWVKWLSPMKYGFSGLFKNEMGGLTEFCPNSKDSIQDQQAHHCLTTDQVIHQFGLDDSFGVYGNLGILAAFWIALLVLSYMALWRIVRGSKRVDFTAKRAAKTTVA